MVQPMFLGVETKEGQRASLPQMRISGLESLQPE
jgi:hypothetical protein